MSGERKRTHISSWSEEKEPSENESNIENRAEPAADATVLVEIGSIVLPTHAQVGRAPEDEAEK